MKKAKIMLTALTLLAVVGGVAAFRYSAKTTLFTHKSGDPATKCTIAFDTFTTDQAHGTQINATLVSTEACGTFYTTSVEP